MLKSPTPIIYIIVCEAWEEFIKIKKELYEIKIKQEIIVPPIQEFISEWLENKLLEIAETN